MINRIQLSLLLFLVSSIVMIEAGAPHLQAILFYVWGEMLNITKQNKNGRL